MKAGSLFSGVGGLDLGLERAGMTVAWQCEKDKQARQVLRRHWPDVPIYEDVHDVGRDQRAEHDPESRTEPDTSGEKRGRLQLALSTDHLRGSERHDRLEAVDVICGGFPCQDYSVAGQRGGLAGDRGALWWEMHRIIAECRPTWVVGENVPGLLSSNGGRDFLTIIESLVQLGYGVNWATLDSQYFGVAQRRRRLFIVGHLGGVPRPEVLALSEGLFGHPAPSREAGEGATGGPKRGVNWDGGEIAGALGTTTNRQLMPDKGRMQAVVAPTVTSKWAKGSGGPAGTECNNLVTQSVTSPIAFHPTSVHHMGCREDGLGPTLKVGSGIGITGTASVVDCAIPRRLTPLECERLQGFPDGWTEFYADGSRVADGPRYRMMGNAVTVNSGGMDWTTHNERK